VSWAGYFSFLFLPQIFRYLKFGKIAPTSLLKFKNFIFPIFWLKKNKKCPKKTPGRGENFYIDISRKV